MHGRNHRPGGSDPIPGIELAVSDGFTTVDPTALLTIPRASGVLSDLGGGNALFQVGNFQSFTPVLSVTTGTDPSGSYTIRSLYYHGGNLICCWGKLETGSGFDPGSGQWQISVPYGFDLNDPRLVGFASIVNLATPSQAMQFQLVGGGVTALDTFSLYYQSAWPVGDGKVLEFGSDWTFSDSDTLIWCVVYPTTETSDNR